MSGEIVNIYYSDLEDMMNMTKSEIQEILQDLIDSGLLDVVHKSDSYIQVKESQVMKLIKKKTISY